MKARRNSEYFAEGKSMVLGIHLASLHGGDHTKIVLKDNYWEHPSEGGGHRQQYTRRARRLVIQGWVATVIGHALMHLLRRRMEHISTCPECTDINLNGTETQDT